MTDDQVIYLMKRNKKPDVYFPLEPENISESLVVGEGISGTLYNKGNTSPQRGKVGQGLRVRGGQIKLIGHQCFSDIAACPDDSLTVMMWIKQTARGDPHLTFSPSNSINIKLNGDQTMRVWVHWNSFPYNILDNIDSTSAVELNTWTHVAAVYNHNIGGFIYLNGIMETFKSISESEDGNIPADPSVLYFGGKEGHYHFYGVLDEIKLFYQYLSSSGWFDLLHLRLFFKYPT